jgi:hypothetical protein
MVGSYQIIEYEKYDATCTCKMNPGYFPSVATTGDKIVYPENRDGNAHVEPRKPKRWKELISFCEKTG